MEKIAEAECLAACVRICEDHGYGVVIGHLQELWARTLMRDHGMAAEVAASGAWMPKPSAKAFAERMARRMRGRRRT